MCSGHCLDTSPWNVVEEAQLLSPKDAAWGSMCCLFFLRVVYANVSYMFLRFHNSRKHMVNAQ